MKLGVVGDIHWSKYSSIVRQRGKKYSLRLENCIDSVNWAEEVLKDCDKIIYLGDFFDSDILKSEEITALSELKWNDKEHIFLVGNHELGLHDLSFSSAHLFNIANKVVIDKPVVQVDSYAHVELCFLPYILDNTGRIEDYIHVMTNKIPKIIFSHNDIAGIQLGKFLTTSGFDIEDIECNCDLFINGHLHNETCINHKIYNIGNLTGQNFSEDAFRYGHKVFIINTETLDIQKIENPFAFKFFKFENVEDLLKYNFPSNSVVTAKLYAEQLNKVNEFIKDNENIVAHRFVVSSNNKHSNNLSTNSIQLSVDHLEKFQEFVLDRIGNNDLVNEEILEVVR